MSSNSNLNTMENKNMSQGTTNVLTSNINVNNMNPQTQTMSKQIANNQFSKEPINNQFKNRMVPEPYLMF